jgi:hypothetical protein
MLRGVAGVVLAIAVAACSLDRSGLGTRDGGGHDDGAADAPVDRTASPRDAGDAGTDALVACADDMRECQDGDLVICEGGLERRVTCPLGCARGRGDDPAGCIAPSPSNVGGRLGPHTDGTTAITIGTADAPEHWIVDTDSGEIAVTLTGGSAGAPRRDGGGPGVIDGMRWEVMSQGDGVPALGILSMESLHVPRGASLFAHGGRALVVLVEREVSVEGAVSVACTRDGTTVRIGAAGRPGGRHREEEKDGFGLGGGARGIRGSSDEPDEGGGGGGFGTGGGDGSGSTRGGPTYGTPELVPLRGGSGGGVGGDDDGGEGGAGGGAIQLSAGGSIAVRGSGVVTAGGCGGQGGIADVAFEDTGAGGGGGSGGGILIEAPAVSIEGWITAGGGAGGQGARCDNCALIGANGSDATTDGSAAAGSATEGLGGGGGAGSDGEGVAGSGLDAGNGGGGGGGAGRIRINTRAGDESYVPVFPQQTSAAMSVGVMDGIAP